MGHDYHCYRNDAESVAPHPQLNSHLLTSVHLHSFWANYFWLFLSNPRDPRSSRLHTHHLAYCRWQGPGDLCLFVSVSGFHNLFLVEIPPVHPSGCYMYDYTSSHHRVRTASGKDRYSVIAVIRAAVLSVSDASSRSIYHHLTLAE